jgi:prepilin-type N-terminal cleavage/methylation domain-containing protein
MRRRRGMTLLEIMVVGAIGATVAAATTVNIVEQIRRTKATDAARGAIHPHTIARDRAVAARLCTETIMVPALGQPFTPPPESGPPQFPANAQRGVPRIAVMEWSSCSAKAVITRVDFFDLDGDITLAPYDSIDGRAVFGFTGGLTKERPGPEVAFIAPPQNIPSCQPPPPAPPPGSGIAEGEGEGEPDPKGESTCKPPPPVADTGPPPDITFAATTYFGVAENYRIYARVGATEHLK